jgi:hypothetical protein
MTCVCVGVQEVRLYLDYKADESYTPSRLSIRAGSAYHDLKVRQHVQQQQQGCAQACMLEGEFCVLDPAARRTEQQ